MIRRIKQEGLDLLGSLSSNKSTICKKHIRSTNKSKLKVDLLEAKKQGLTNRRFIRSSL